MHTHTRTPTDPTGGRTRSGQAVRARFSSSIRRIHPPSSSAAASLSSSRLPPSPPPVARSLSSVMLRPSVAPVRRPSSTSSSLPVTRPSPRQVTVSDPVSAASSSSASASTLLRLLHRSCRSCRSYCRCCSYVTVIPCSIASHHVTGPVSSARLGSSSGPTVGVALLLPAASGSGRTHGRTVGRSVCVPARRRTVDRGALCTRAAAAAAHTPPSLPHVSGHTEGPGPGQDRVQMGSSSKPGLTC